MKKILAIGEVLFDVINGKEHIGGAPFNYIFHLSSFNEHFKLGFKIDLATKICNDERGNRVLQFFKNNNISLDLLQANDVYETGVVYASVDAFGNAHYHIVEHCAYDYIDYTTELASYLKSGIQFLYYNTLFLRSGHNRNTLAKCLPDDAIFNQKILIDFNFRQNYYSWEIIDDCLLNASYIKLNLDELQLLNRKYLSKWKFDNEKEVVDYLLNEYVLDAVILTRGSQGASIYIDDLDYWETDSPKCGKIVDTIGAGDAFSSVFTLGQLLGWPPIQTLERATQFATDICTISGAIPQTADWYIKYQPWF